MFYMIEESVNKSGVFITWPGIYMTRASAERELAKQLANLPTRPNVRIWPYQQGSWNGPIRLASDYE
jgi:hypothetical protein